MWLTILAHGGEIGWDELALFIVAGLFVVVGVWAWLSSRSFKPVMDEAVDEAGNLLAEEDKDSEGSE